MAGERRGSLIDVDDSGFAAGLAKAYEELSLTASAELVKLAVDIVKRAKELCPVDYGILRAAIDFAPGAENGEFFVDVGVILRPVSLPKDHASPEAYDLYVEFGTRFMAPEPFMRPAIAEAVQAQLGVPVTDFVGLVAGRSTGRGRSLNGQFFSLTRRIAVTRRSQLTGRRHLGRPAARKVA